MVFDCFRAMVIFVVPLVAVGYMHYKKQKEEREAKERNEEEEQSENDDQCSEGFGGPRQSITSEESDGDNVSNNPAPIATSHLQADENQQKPVGPVGKLMQFCDNLEKEVKKAQERKRRQAADACSEVCNTEAIQPSSVESEASNSAPISNSVEQADDNLEKPVGAVGKLLLFCDNIEREVKKVQKEKRRQLADALESAKRSGLFAGVAIPGTPVGGTDQLKAEPNPAIDEPSLEPSSVGKAENEIEKLYETNEADANQDQATTREDALRVAASDDKPVCEDEDQVEEETIPRGTPRLEQATSSTMQKSREEQIVANALSTVPDTPSFEEEESEVLESFIAPQLPLDTGDRFDSASHILSRTGEYAPNLPRIKATR